MARGDAAATRAKLLKAGVALAGDQALGGLRVDALVAHAGVAKGTFYLHFDSRADYLVALHRAFHDEVATHVRDAVAGARAGVARLHKGSCAYLDGCLQRSGVKALLLGARVEPGIQREVAVQNARFMGIAAADFRAAGWPAPETAARLWVGMVAEAAVAEAEGGRANAKLRTCLARFLKA